MTTLLLGLAMLAAPAAAQPVAPGFQAVSSTVAYSTMAALGVPLALEGGPWVVGDVRFEGYKAVSLISLENKVRAQRGALYTPTDIQGDLDSIKELPAVSSVTAGLYGIPDQPVPDNYRTIAVSTMMVRIVFRVKEKTLALPGMAVSTAAAHAPLPPASISGVVMTPTAYRGVGQYNTPGLGLDFNAVYFIGRLYGKNSLSTHQTNYIDRIGVWFLSADAKMQVQSEAELRPAMAVGAEGLFTFRDAPQPSIATPGVTVNVSRKTTRELGDTYFVLSKKLWKARMSAGYAYGNAAERIALLSEFMAPQALQFEFNAPNPVDPVSHSMPFASLLFLPKPSYPLAVEVLKPEGLPLKPVLFNFKLGYFLKMNFDLSYLRFQGGWDLLGQFAFRYTHFPRTAPAGYKGGGG